MSMTQVLAKKIVFVQALNKCFNIKTIMQASSSNGRASDSQIRVLGVRIPPGLPNHSECKAQRLKDMESYKTFLTVSALKYTILGV